nr:MAG TPA: hypothetical protein [Crassvirales sp.]
MLLYFKVTSLILCAIITLILSNFYHCNSKNSHTLLDDCSTNC